VTQLSVLYFECRYLQTENVPRRQDKISGLIVFGKKAVCSEVQIRNISDVFTYYHIPTNALIISFII
jgi:hypothetical protein